MAGLKSLTAYVWQPYDPPAAGTGGYGHSYTIRFDKGGSAVDATFEARNVKRLPVLSGPLPVVGSTVAQVDRIKNLMKLLTVVGFLVAHVGEKWGVSSPQLKRVQQLASAMKQTQKFMFCWVLAAKGLNTVPLIGNSRYHQDQDKWFFDLVPSLKDKGGPVRALNATHSTLLVVFGTMGIVQTFKDLSGAKFGVFEAKWNSVYQNVSFVLNWTATSRAAINLIHSHRHSSWLAANKSNCLEGEAQERVQARIDQLTDPVRRRKHLCDLVKYGTQALKLHLQGLLDGRMGLSEINQRGVLLLWDTVTASTGLTKTFAASW